FRGAGETDVVRIDLDPAGDVRPMRVELVDERGRAAGVLVPAGGGRALVGSRWGGGGGGGSWRSGGRPRGPGWSGRLTARRGGEGWAAGGGGGEGRGGGARCARFGGRVRPDVPRDRGRARWAGAGRAGAFCRRRPRGGRPAGVDAPPRDRRCDDGRLPRRRRG